VVEGLIQHPEEAIAIFIPMRRYPIKKKNLCLEFDIALQYSPGHGKKIMGFRIDLSTWRSSS
jgi:hypothetical protein